MWLGGYPTVTYIGYLYPCHNQLCSYLETEEELDGYDELADDSP